MSSGFDSLMQVQIQLVGSFGMLQYIRLIFCLYTYVGLPKQISDLYFCRIPGHIRRDCPLEEERTRWLQIIR